MIPMDQTVNAFETAYFPCHIPGKGLPVWVINSVEYVAAELPADHTVNTSGLLVYAREEYNNTVYRCRFVQLTVNEFGFLDEEITTSPPAVLTVLECECNLNNNVLFGQVKYMYVSYQ